MAGTSASATATASILAAAPIFSVAKNSAGSAVPQLPQQGLEADVMATRPVSGEAVAMWWCSCPVIAGVGVDAVDGCIAMSGQGKGHVHTPHKHAVTHKTINRRPSSTTIKVSRPRSRVVWLVTVQQL
ncbi:MAG: hypothetical protein ND807_07780 [Vicinamibacterales bacterium]|nr:hypothetical protein [Vicinamibacterales bacterium]